VPDLRSTQLDTALLVGRRYRKQWSELLRWSAESKDSQGNEQTTFPGSIPPARNVTLQFNNRGLKTELVWRSIC
jgi:hypothetical protein